MNSKPNGAKAGWRLLESRRRFQNEICTLREDEIELRGRERMNFAYLERAEAVIVVPVTRDGRIVLINQYRYPVDEWCLEVPAGGTHDAPNESLEEVARKELREEVGASCDSLSHVDFFYPANSMTDEKCHVFLAEGVTLSEERDREASEALETKLVLASEAVALARGGKLKTAPCALAILLCEPLLCERGYLR
jgi:ADP-ribose pyrophosphatase